MMAILAASTALLIALLSTNSSCSASSIRKQQEEAYEPPHIHCPDNEQFTDKEFTIAPAGTYEVIFYTNNYRKAWKLETDNNGKFMAPVLDIINTNVELNVNALKLKKRNKQSEPLKQIQSNINRPLSRNEKNIFEGTYEDYVCHGLTVKTVGPSNFVIPLTLEALNIEEAKKAGEYKVHVESLMKKAQEKHYPNHVAVENETKANEKHFAEPIADNFFGDHQFQYV